jgi:hypothetical protein
VFEVRARFIVEFERERIAGDTELVDGSLTAADKRRLGIGSIFDAPLGDGGGGGGTAMPIRSWARELATALFRAARELLGREAA